VTRTQLVETLHVIYKIEVRIMVDSFIHLYVSYNYILQLSIFEVELFVRLQYQCEYERQIHIKEMHFATYEIGQKRGGQSESLLQSGCAVI
jgi:hypothetical protein